MDCEIDKYKAESTPRGRLENQKAALEKQLVQVNEALKLLDENPAFEKCFEALQKAL